MTRHIKEYEQGKEAEVVWLRTNVIDGIAESHERSDDGSSARTEHQIKLFVQLSLYESLNLFENSERVKALRAATIEAQYPAKFFPRVAHRTNLRFE